LLSGILQLFWLEPEPEPDFDNWPDIGQPESDIQYIQKTRYHILIKTNSMFKNYFPNGQRLDGSLLVFFIH